MPVPDFQTVMLPVLRLADGGEVRAADAVDRISDESHLTPDERAELLPSGRQAKIANRVHWAVTYLVKAGLLSRPRRGVFAITERGRKVLANPPARIDINFLSQFDGFDEFRTKPPEDPEDIESEPSTEPTATLAAGTPDERIEAAFNDLNATLRAELLDRVQTMHPTAFEKLIIDLMLGMAPMRLPFVAPMSNNGLCGDWLCEVSCAMQGSDLDQLIDELEHLVTSSFSPLEGRMVEHRYDLISGSMIYDWRPAWDKANAIQELFKTVRYPTKAERDRAWVRFNDIRNDLSRRANADRAKFREVSQSWRDKVVEDLRPLRYVFVPILSDIDPTTVDEMKELGRLLKEARNLLHEKRSVMLREHKDECYALAEEIKQSHDRFWEQYHKSRETRRLAHVQAMREKAEKIEGNLQRNREKREKAVGALERVEANISKNEDMLASAYSDNYRERVEGWLADSIEKRDSILESIRRFDEWIAQDEDRLSELRSKIFARE